MNITEFLLAVMAGVVCHYICKWLDRREQRECEQQERESGNHP